MDNEELEGVKFSEFPSATPGDSDEVVGLHAGDNARFSVANFVLAIRQGLANIFVPLTRTINGKALSTDISLDSSGIEYDNTGSGLTATNVQAAIDEAATGLNGKQSTITASGILKGDGAGGVSAATPGTDYQAPLTAGTDYATPAQISSLVLKTASAFALPASGSSVSKDMSGLTVDHELIRWNYYDNGAIIPENQPPADLTWTTYAGYFTITNNGGTTTATIQPVFAIPSATAISNH